jgi:hypothetical protein
MNIKLTIILLSFAVIAGIVFIVNPFTTDTDKGPPKPWFYQVHVDDMTGIEIVYNNEVESFIKTPSNTWAFTGDPQIPTDRVRFGAIDFLLGGPQTKRDLSETNVIIENPAQYGLDAPHTTVTIKLTLDRTLQFNLGDKTTDGNHHYGQVIGFPQLFLISDTWGDVIARLVYEKPLPKWFRPLNPLRIVEVNVFGKSDDPENQTNYVSYIKKQGEWEVTDYRIDTKAKKIDAEKFGNILPTLSRPENVGIVTHRVWDKDYTEWELTDNSMLVEIRFEEISEEGTKFKDSVVFHIGKTTVDGSSRYARPENDDPYQPVLVLPLDWLSAIMGLYNDVPYMGTK